MAWSAQAIAQRGADSGSYGRVNSFGFFAAYSGDSSHIVLGYAENRKLVDLGVTYGRRLYLNHAVNWQYNVELLPVALESDPLQVTAATYTFTDPSQTISQTTSTPTLTACQNMSGSGTLPGGGPTYTFTDTCSRRWTIGEAMSPIGFEWNFLPRSKTQPFLIGHGGYMYSTQAIPITDAGSFNFTFDVGAGVEFFRTHSRSVRGELRFHHISNHGTAALNPGIDSLLYQVTYAFGR